ncbi:unnamed protein product [Spirodela intermedia]|uniref:Uncharacterized protein n=1 Tax=Spirodela intermedia TaxID=51605 RepID=A0A7I8KT00_SPIIN|nr:unnamed protein product [Spirodela intermedia]
MPTSLPSTSLSLSLSLSLSHGEREREREREREATLLFVLSRDPHQNGPISLSGLAH